jgi:hypothetical protein
VTTLKYIHKRRKKYTSSHLNKTSTTTGACAILALDGLYIKTVPCVRSTSATIPIQSASNSPLRKSLQIWGHTMERLLKVTSIHTRTILQTERGDIWPCLCWRRAFAWGQGYWSTELHWTWLTVKEVLPSWPALSWRYSLYISRHTQPKFWG